MNNSERQPFEIVTAGFNITTINARPITIEGFEEYRFFVHTSDDPEKPNYIISEASTGTKVGEGLKWYDAAHDAEQYLKSIGKEAFNDICIKIVLVNGRELNKVVDNETAI